MLGDERVVVDEALVNTGENSVGEKLVGEDVGEDDPGVIIADDADAGEAVLDRSRAILIGRMIGK